MNLFTRIGLGVRITIVAVLVVLTVVGVNYAVFAKDYRASMHEKMIERAASFTALADETKNHVAKLAAANAFDREGLVREYEEITSAGGHYRDSTIFSTLPIVAGWTAAGEAAEREGMDFNIRAFNARNPDYEPSNGSFEADLLGDLVSQVSSGGDDWIARVNPDTNALHYLRAVTLTEDCMLCHGQPGGKYDQDGDGKDLLGFPMEGWTPGGMHGAYQVVAPLGPLDAQVASFLGSGLAVSVPMVVIAIVGFVVMLRLMFSRPVRAMVERVKDIAEGEGDLTARITVKREDELGLLARYFNIFIENIQGIITQVTASANQVAAAATEIAASSEEMSRGMEQQSSQLAQISSALEEMAASVTEVARKSTDATREASESGRAAEEGGTIVQGTVEGMQAISEAVTASADSVGQLGRRGEQIGEIISVINDIADQTNLLALNAAIEAARAGEHGRGFAVVADEVRKLADRTTKATEEISESIREIQSETANAVQRMNTGTDQVNEGVERATQAGQSLDQIVQSARSVSSVIAEIAAATEQQAATSEEISRNIEGINAVTQETVQGASQAASASVELSSRAEELRALVSRFKI
ncbi:MAG: methyl-accepting chemotaxis protein [Phycisphaerales bacterium JB050]